MKNIFAVFIFFNLWISVQAQVLLNERLYKTGTTPRGIIGSNLTRQGNVIFAGNISNDPDPDMTPLFMLVKPDLDTIWNRNGPIMPSVARMPVKQTQGKGFAFYGTIRTPGTINYTDMLLQKLDANGFPQWSQVLDNNNYEWGDLLLPAPDTGFFLSGSQGLINSPPHRPFYLARADSLGNLKWQKDYSWSSGEQVMDIDYTRHGEIIMAGTTHALVPPYANILKLMVVNQNGDSIRSRRLAVISPTRFQGMDSRNSITSLSDGGFLITGRMDTVLSPGGMHTTPMGMVIKTNAALQPVWHFINRQQLPDRFTFMKAKELADSSVLVLGHVEGYYSNKFYLYRFSSVGVLINVYTFTSSITTGLRPVTFDALADSTFVIGGAGWLNPYTPNWLMGLYVAKVNIAGLPPVLGTKSSITELKSNIVLGQSYPNPTASEAVIPYTLPQSYGKASIVLREIATGREIRRFELKQGNSSLSVDLSNLSNGLYLYTLVVDEKPVATKKLAVMR